jgi:hypothetical protein
VPPILFPSLRYVRRKPCTNPASRVTLSPNGPSRASTLASSPGSLVECIQNDLYAYGMLGANVHLSCTNTNTISKRTKIRFHTTHVTYKFHRVRPKLFMSLWYVQCKPCTYLASRLALSPNEPNQAPPNRCHLGVPSGASKTIYEPMVCLTQTEHLSALTLTLSQNRSKRDST